MTTTDRTIRIYWFRRQPNFGDAIAPHLVARFAGLDAVWSEPSDCEAVVIGSVAGRVAHGYHGIIVGIGKLRESVELDLSSAGVLGLRGQLTARDSKALGSYALGDPGLLAIDMLDDRPAALHPLGTVAHWKDTRLRDRYPGALHIDVGDDPLLVIGQIASCERIVSSSLHGLVVADSFGIPRRWEHSPDVGGGTFKFRDYATALGVEIEPDAWDSAPPSRVERVRAELRDAFASMPQALTDGRQQRPRKGVRGYLRQLATGLTR